MGQSRQSSNSWPQAKSIVLQYWQLIIIGVLFIVVQLPVLADWWGIWNEKDSYYSHGPLVPFLALFLLWINRKIIAQTPIKPSWYGLLILAVGAPVHSVAMLMEVRMLYMLTFFITLFGILLLFLGWRMVKVVAVPVLFLVTMMPIASGIIDSLTANAQLVSATVATKFLQFTGYDVTQYGNIIRGDGLPDDLRVASPCSGLRLLISLVTFSWFFTCLIVAPRWKKAVIFLMSFPLAVFINSLRITMIGYVGFWIGTVEAMHTFHDYSGYIGLGVCFFILFGIARLLRCMELDSSREPKYVLESKHDNTKTPTNAKFVSAVIILAALAYVGNAVQPLYRLPKGQINRAAIPLKFGIWSGTNSDIDDETKAALEKGDLLNRRYVDDLGRPVQVFLDVGGAGGDLSAFHDPHLCMTGSGNTIQKERQYVLPIAEPYPTKLRVTSFELAGRDSTGIVLYWYMLGKDSYALTNDLGSVKRGYWFSDLKDILRNPFGLEALRKKVMARHVTWYRFSTDRMQVDESDFKFIEGFAKEFVANKADFGQ